MNGHVEPGYEDVAAALEAAVELPGDLGAGLAVVRDGRRVVDLQVGEMRDGVPWHEHALCCGFSVGKAVTATAMAVLVDRGLVELDAPVARVWPEFAANGKADITLRMVLTHQAGTSWIPDHRTVVHADDPGSFHDLERIFAAIAAAPPTWEPGSRVGYATMTVGWIAAAITERVTGMTLGPFLAEAVAAPLGLHDLFLGVPAARLDDVVDLVPSPEWDAPEMRGLQTPETPAGRAICIGSKPFGETLETLWNDDRYRTAEQPAINLQASAGDLARLMAVWAGDGAVGDARLFSAATAAEFRREQVATDADAMIHSPLRLGLLLWRPVGSRWFGPHDEAVGHVGIGGAFAMADPVQDVALAFLPRRLTMSGLAGTEDRVRRIIDAVYAA